VLTLHTFHPHVQTDSNHLIHRHVAALPRDSRRQPWQSPSRLRVRDGYVGGVKRDRRWHSARGRDTKAGAPTSAGGGQHARLGGSRAGTRRCPTACPPSQVAGLVEQAALIDLPPAVAPASRNTNGGTANSCQRVRSSAWSASRPPRRSSLRSSAVIAAHDALATLAALHVPV